MLRAKEEPGVRSNSPPNQAVSKQMSSDSLRIYARLQNWT